MSAQKRKRVKPEEKPVTAYNVWSDPATPGVVYQHAEFMKRLVEVYGIDPKTTRGQRKMNMHMDGDTWYASEWDWTIGGKEFRQSTRDLRRGEDLAYWSHGE